MTIQTISGWPPENTVFEVEAFDLSVLPGAHPVYVAHRDEIEENWAGKRRPIRISSTARWCCRTDFRSAMA